MSERSLSRGAQLLRQWRGERPQSQVHNALGLDAGRYSAYETGRLTPGLKKAAAIERATDGAVPMASWLEPALDEPIVDATTAEEHVAAAREAV